MPEYKVISEEPLEGERKPDGSEEKKSEELILGRFKSQDELVKAYQEAEAKMTQEAQKRADYERQVQELQAMQTKPIVAQSLPVEDSEALTQKFWADPVNTMKSVLTELVDPIYTDRYESQKDRYRSDPEFTKLEPQIDLIVKQYPNLKSQRGIVDQLYKMVRGLTFDPEAYERMVREKIRLETGEKIAGSLEGGSPAPLPSGGVKKIELNSEQKRVALKMYPEAETSDKAYDLYINALQKA